MPEIHLRFGGSTAHRWMACPGSARLVAAAPPQRVSAAMQAGTEAHSVLEHALRYGDDVPEDMPGVALAVNYVRSVIDDMENPEQFIESLVQISDEVGGTADVILYDHATGALHVIDYKNGRRYVDASPPQLQFYAACALATHIVLEPTVIYCTIIQPHGETGDSIRTAVFKPEDIEAFSAEAEAAVKAAQEPDAPAIPGSHCKWCPAFATCPAGFERTANMPKDEVTKLPDLPDPEGDEYLNGMSALVHLLPRVKAWVKMVDERVGELAARGEIPPDCKLSQRKLARVWVDEEMAQKWLDTVDGIDKDTYMPRTMLSVAKLEEVVGNWVVELAKDAGHTKQPLSKATLAPVKASKK